MITKNSSSGSLSVDIRTRYPQLPIILILVAATCVFFYKLGSEGVWIDELFSIRDASQFDSPIEVYKASRLRPLYYVLLSVWMRFGTSDVWLRSLSVIFAIVSVFLIYQLGKRVAGEAEGLIAASLLTVSPLFVNHAQEVRMYALSLCMGLAGSVFLANALLTEPEQKPGQKVIGSWALFRLLAILTVPLNLTLLIPDALLVLWRFRKQPGVIAHFALWTSLVLLLWVPAIAPLLQDASSTSDYAIEREDFAAAPGLGNLVYPLKFWMVYPFVVQGSRIATIFYKLFTLPIAGLVGAGLIYKHRSPALVWSFAWFIIPLVPIVVFSMVAARIWEPRYVLFVSPYLFILIAAGFTRLWKEWRVAAIAAIAIYTVGTAGALHHYYSVQNRADYRANIETIEQYEQPGDAVVWGHDYVLALDHYYDGPSNVYQLSGRDIDTPEELRQWINQFPTGYDRIWFVIEDFRYVQRNFEEIITEKYSIEEMFKYDHRSAVVLLTSRFN